LEGKRKKPDIRRRNLALGGRGPTGENVEKKGSARVPDEGAQTRAPGRYQYKKKDY